MPSLRADVGAGHAARGERHALALAVGERRARRRIGRAACATSASWTKPASSARRAERERWTCAHARRRCSRYASPRRTTVAPDARVVQRPCDAAADRDGAGVGDERRACASSRVARRAQATGTARSRVRRDARIDQVIAARRVARDPARPAVVQCSSSRGVRCRQPTHDAGEAVEAEARGPAVRERLAPGWPAAGARSPRTTASGTSLRIEHLSWRTAIEQLPSSSPAHGPGRIDREARRGFVPPALLEKWRCRDAERIADSARQVLRAMAFE